jgi:ribonuclease BN (tRNA processing enzyme)
MRILCGGVRGSAQTNHPDFMGFGGETTSYLVQSSAGDQIVFDLGSGIRTLVPHLRLPGANPILRVFFTHYHLDHLAGIILLPFLYGRGGRLEVYAPDHLECTAREAIERLFAPPYWPLRVDQLAIERVFYSLPTMGGPATVDVGGLRITACATCHPGGSTAYRLEDLATGGTAVLATDVEWGAASAAQRDQLLHLCTAPRPANLLLMDGQYSPEDFPARAGWGHSTWREAAELARHAGIPRLAVTHHDERNTDTLLRAVEARLQRECPTAFLARQGDWFEVAP